MSAKFFRRLRHFDRLCTDGSDKLELVLTRELYAAATEDPRRSPLRVTGHDGGAVRLHLSGVEFIDSSCVEMLIEAQDELDQHGIGLTMARASDEVLAVLRLAGAQDRFPSADSTQV